MFGLTVRWPLQDAPDGVADRLRSYVRTASLPRFTGMPGLHEKVWTMREGAFFAGTYLWRTAEDRAAFLAEFQSKPSPVTEMVGAGPSVEEFEIVAVAEGAEGIAGLPSLGTAHQAA